MSKTPRQIMFFDSKSIETETIINTGNLVTKNVQKLFLKFAKEKDHLKLKENRNRK